MKFLNIGLIFAVIVPVVSGRIGEHRKLKLHGRQDKVIPDSYILVFEDHIQEADPAVNALLSKAGANPEVTVLNNAIKGAVLSKLQWPALRKMLDDPSVKYAAQVSEDGSTSNISLLRSCF